MLLNSERVMRIYSDVAWVINIIMIVVTWVFPVGSDFVFLIPLLLIPPWISLVFHLQKRKGEVYDQVFSKIPRVIKIVGLVCIGYAFINMLVNMPMLRDGSPEVIKGIYYLSNRSGEIEITESEFITLRFSEGRFMWGHILAFTTVSMCCHSVKNFYGRHYYVEEGLKEEMKWKLKR